MAIGEDSQVTWLSTPLQIGLDQFPDGTWLIFAQVDNRGTSMILVDNLH